MLLFIPDKLAYTLSLPINKWFNGTAALTYP